MCGFTGTKGLSQVRGNVGSFFSEFQADQFKVLLEMTLYWAVVCTMKALYSRLHLVTLLPVTEADGCLCLRWGNQKELIFHIWSIWLPFIHSKSIFWVSVLWMSPIEAHEQDRPCPCSCGICSPVEKVTNDSAKRGIPICFSDTCKHLQHLPLSTESSRYCVGFLDGFIVHYKSDQSHSKNFWDCDEPLLNFIWKNNQATLKKKGPRDRTILLENETFEKE